MARYRIELDVVTTDGDELSERQADALRREVENYLHVVALSDVEVDVEKKETHSTVHQHVSTSEIACRYCSRVSAPDELQ